MAAKLLRTWATARKTAFVNSLTVWNSQIWCGTPGNARRQGIQGGSVGSDAFQGQAAFGQDALETTHEVEDVLVGGIVIEHSIQQAFESAVVDKRQDTERAIVQFINGDVA
jgi:hypothetical protein